MATPADNDFIISQGDSLPLMRIPIPANSAGQLLDLADCHVTFLGRVKGKRDTPPPIIRPIDSYASETHDFGDGAVPVIAVYVRFTTTDTKVPTGKDDYVEMEGEVEIVDLVSEAPIVNVLTIPSLGYLRWWIRDDIGDGAVV